MLQLLMSVLDSPVVTLSGETVEHSVSSPTNAIAAIRFNADGTVDRIVGGTPTQVDFATDWIIPNSAAPGGYQVRFTSLTGDAPTVTDSTAEDAWYAFTSGNFDIRLQEFGTGLQSCSFTVEIRLGSSGSAIASGSYNLTAEVI